MVAEIHALAPDPEPEETGILRLSRRKPTERETRVIVFYVEQDDGKEIAYSVPKNPPANISLRALELLETRGEEVAVYYMLKTMLGEDGYRALMEHDGLTTAELAQVMKKVQEIANGAMEGPKAG